MRFDEIKWEDYKTKTYQVSGYESDGNTLKVAEKRLIPMDDILGEGYDNLALKVINGRYCNNYLLYKRIGDLWIDAKCCIPQSIPLEDFKEAIDKQREIFTEKAFIYDIKRRCSEIKHISLSELYALSKLNPLTVGLTNGEMERLIERCIKTRHSVADKRAMEEAEREREAAEREAKYEAEMERQYAEEKDKIITCIKNHCVAQNVDCDNGKNVIISMCEDAEIKIPIRTKGFMLDKTKLHSFRYGNDGTITIWGRGNSQKVWDILSQLCNYYK